MYKIKTQSDLVHLKEYYDDDPHWNDYDIEEPAIDEWADNGYSISDFI